MPPATADRDAPDDAALLAAVLARRDTQSFGLLVARHERPVRAFLTQLCRGQIHLVDDLAQETFIKALEKLHQVRDSTRLRAWLNGIAYREFLMWQRSTRRQGEVLEELARQPQAVREPDPAALELDRLLSVLSENERTAIVLNHGGGLSHSEIAAALELPLGTIKALIARGKQRIRDTFDAPSISPSSTAEGSVS